MLRSPRADDLYGLRAPTAVRISPDGSSIAFVVKEVSPDKDAYRQSIWLAPADGSAPARRLTLGATADVSPRWSPDGRTLAFLSDRGAVLAAGGGGDRARTPTEEDRGADRARGSVQVWLLPIDGGEARQLTRLPEDVTDLAWSPDGSRLCLVSAATSTEAKRGVRRPGEPPARDARLIDRLQYMSNGSGFTYDRPKNLWLATLADGTCRLLTRGPSNDDQPAWSPDGGRICFASNRHRDADITERQDLYLVGADGGRVTRLSGGRGERLFGHPAWSPDGQTVAAIGHRLPMGSSSAGHVWVFVPRPEQAGEDLMADSDLMIGAALNSDVFGFASPDLTWSADGAWLLINAPFEGSYELWRLRRSDGGLERLTRDEHAVTRAHGAAVGDGMRVAAVRSSGHEPPDVVAAVIGPLRDRPAAPVRLRRLTHLTADAWHDASLVAPVSRWHESDGRRIQGWFMEAPRRGGRPAPLVVQIHGGPATLYGWTLMWEWQCLVAAGISVYAPNPRGSEGYGQAFCRSNFADWGDGPMRDVMAGVDSLIEDGLVDPARLGVTGGSYGGYLTAWIIGHTDRFAAAVSCRGVYDLNSEMLSGDLAGPLFGANEYGVNPWQDPELYRRHSPIAYAQEMRTPLLIQHAENDLRCPMTQAEELFTVLRSLRRPVRLMRVPDESHELTRAGAPFRRVENIERIRDWFVHFLVHQKTGLPPA